MWAAAEGHAPVVRALIEAGADINATLDSGFTPFFFAVREGRIEAARALLEKGIDVNAPIQRRERTAEGANPNYILYRPIPRGTSPLLLAVQNAHYELAIALIDAGANPNDVQTGFSPLHMISGVRKPDSSDGSDPSTPAGSGSLTSLQFVREIVKRGANVNLRLDKGAPQVSRHVLANRHPRGDPVSSGRRSLRRPADAPAAGVGRRSDAAEFQQHDAAHGRRRPRHDRAARRGR